MPRRASSKVALGIGILVAGCVAACAQRVGADDWARNREAPIERKPEQLTVFAEKAFYRERTEPEQSFRGVLRTAEVRQGPDTRETPLQLSADEGEPIGVYVAGFDVGALAPFVNRRVEIVGKRIDLRSEGHGVEIWIATITREQR